MSFRKIKIFTCTKVVPKLVLILSRQTCNTICRNSNKAHVFCSALSFQQALLDVCTSNKFRVIAGFVKTVACTLKKKKKTVRIPGLVAEVKLL